MLPVPDDPTYAIDQFLNLSEFHPNTTSTQMSSQNIYSQDLFSQDTMDSSNVDTLSRTGSKPESKSSSKVRKKKRKSVAGF